MPHATHTESGALSRSWPPTMQTLTVEPCFFAYISQFSQHGISLAIAARVAALYARLLRSAMAASAARRMWGGEVIFIISAAMDILTRSFLLFNCFRRFSAYAVTKLFTVPSQNRAAARWSDISHIYTSKTLFPFLRVQVLRCREGFPGGCRV